MESDLNPCKFLLAKIFYGNVSVNSQVTEVITEFPPREILNSITMADNGGLGEQGTYVEYPLTTLDPTDPNYNPNNPDELYNKERRYQEVSKGSISLHVWGNTSAERDKIITQMKRLLKLAKKNHYLFCTNYEQDGTCKTTGKPCDAIAQTGDIKPCPYPYITDSESPYYRNPSTWWIYTGVRKTDFVVGGSTNADQYNIQPPVYHTYMNVDYMLDEYLSESVNPALNVKTDFNME